MTIDKTKTVDAIYIDSKTGDVVLTITDHLNWTDDADNHQFLLQEKLNAYLSYIESGEMIESYPAAKGKPVLIDVVCKYPLSKVAEYFYSQVTSVIEDAGFKIQYRFLSE